MTTVRLQKGKEVIHADDSQVPAFVNQGWKKVADTPVADGAVVPNESPGSIQFRQERLAERGAVLLVRGEAECIAEKAQVERMLADGWKVAGADEADEAEKPEPTGPNEPPGSSTAQTPEGGEGQQQQGAGADEG